MRTNAQPWSPRQASPKHWSPFTTRTPWLMVILLAVLACVAVIEVALRTDVGATDHNEAASLARRQDFVEDEVDSTTEDEIESISIDETAPEISYTYAETDDFLAMTTSSDDPFTRTDVIIATSANSEDFIAITTASTDGTAATPTATEAAPRITVPAADPTGAPMTLEIVPIVTTMTSNGVTAVISTSTTRPAPTTASVVGIKSSQVQLSPSFTGFHYAFATYSAVLVAVILKLAWGLIFSGLKMMEPFHQLSKSGGATAKESLMADYLSASYGLSHLRHIISGHWAMLFGTMACIIISTLSPVSSELMSIVATQRCPTVSGKMQQCAPVWVINIPAARLVEAVLLLTAAVIFMVICFNFNRKSGVFSNPSSIATMASLLSHDSIRHDLRCIDQTDKNKDILNILAGKRYTLTSFTSPSGDHLYGIVNTNASLTTDSSTTLLHKEHYITTTTSHPYPTSTPVAIPNKSTTFGQTKRLLRDLLFTLLTLLLFTTVLAYYLIGGDNTFNNFFNSKTFGPRFLLTTAASILNFAWTTLEREVRIMTPYRNLGARDASAERSVLVDVGGLPMSSLWGAIRRKEILHAFVAVTAMFSDILIIAVSGVPLAEAQILEAFHYSSYVSMVITAWMLCVMPAVFWWRWQIRKLGLPREPDTILAVGLMLADRGNTVVEEFTREVWMSGSERDGEARRRGARYQGGWMRMEDGSERWCVGREQGLGDGHERWGGL